VVNISARLHLSNDFENKFKENATKEVRKVLLRSYPRIQKGVLRSLRVIVRERIMDSPEYNSMIGGTLRGELGLPDGMSRITRIIEAWVLNIRVKIIQGSSKSLGSLSISMIESTYSDVLGLPEAVLRYTNRKGKSVNLDWLKWLLTEGGSTIVSEYEFTPSSRGRTGLGVMIKSRGGWKVPAQFAGVSTDNFVTRSFEGITKDIEIILRREITKGIK
tara:strand:+ start:3255 stop:3908 length:654 start_codon:yes stop_codon:yes gene_type:complete